MVSSRSTRPPAGSDPDVPDLPDEKPGTLPDASVRLHGVLESLTDAFFTLDRDWRFTYLNAAAEQLLRRRRENLLGKRIGDEFPGSPGDVFHENYRKAREEDRLVEFEATYGPLALWLEVRVHPTDEGLAVALRDVSERRREREALRESVERFRGVARATSDAIWDWNIEEDVTWWSEGMEKLFGHSLSSLGNEATSWSVYIHEDDRNRVLLSVYNAIRGTEEEWSQEYRFGRKDGTWAWVLDRGFVIRNAEGRAVRMVGGMKDLSKRRDAELELARLNRALHMRSACSEAVIRADDEKELLTEICRIAVEIGGYRMAWVGYTEDDEAGSIRPAAHAGFEDGYLSEVALSKLESLPGGRGPAGRAVRSGKPEILEDLQNTPAQTPWQKRALARGYRGILSLPLRDRDDTFGLLGLYAFEVRTITQDEVALLQNLADDLAFGVISLRSRRERERMQVSVSKMASVVSASTSDDFFHQLVRSMCEALGADLGYVAIFLPGLPRRVRAIAAVIDGRVGRIPDLLLDGRPSDALRVQEELVVVSGVAERYPAAPELAERGLDAYVGRRLDNRRGVALGVVAALFREPIVDVGFATSTLRIFAARAAAELERHRLESLKVEQTQILERIATGASLAEVAVAAVRLVESQITGAMCGISLFEDEGRVLRLLAGPNLPADLREAVAVFPVASLGDTVKWDRTVIVADIATDPLTAAFVETPLLNGVRAGWAVPFFASDGQLLGNLSVYLPVSREPDPDEVDMIATSARLIGITIERERAQAALRLSEERVRATFAAAAAGIAISSLGGGGFFVQVNQAFCDMVGYTEEELRGLDVNTLTHPDDLADGIELACRLVSGEIDRFITEKRYVRKDGEVVWARVSVSRVPSGEGQGMDVIAVTQDITALKLAEDARQSLENQLREAQKMEAVGTLAGGIAHDFNNILGAILGNAELARLDCEGNRAALESLGEIRRAGLRAKELIRQILSFSRREAPVRQPVALLPIAEESVRLLNATLSSRAPIRLRGAADLPPVNADPVLILQVLLNLGTNAVHAMFGRPGGVDIDLETVVLDQGSTRLHPNLKAGSWVRLSVTDSGHGMDEATQQRIFEPFFTTKPVGEGTGLGLPVVHGIMRDHEGAIVVESTPGTGTRFDLYFPALTETRDDVAAAAPQPNREAGPRDGTGHTILYIDDDAGLLSLVQRLLSRRGYEVVGHVEGQTAVQELLENPDRFDLVLTDFNMPRMSGIDVARAVREIRVDLPVAITSGYITEAMRSEAEEAGVRALIFKPDVVEALCDEVARVLAQVSKP